MSGKRGINTRAEGRRTREARQHERFRVTGKDTVAQVAPKSMALAVARASEHLRSAACPIPCDDCRAQMEAWTETIGAALRGESRARIPREEGGE